MKRPSLYELLPSLYRRRDRELLPDTPSGATTDAPAAPLEAIFSILQTQFDLLEDDIADMYNDWFVETCSVDALPRLAEPFALSDINLLMPAADTRSLVANIVRYRQAKGTAAAFMGFASDATGWTVHIADGIRTQATTARLDGSATARPGFASLRKGNNERPRSFNFREAPHGTQVANIQVWRARSIPVEDAQPWQFPDDPRRRTFNPAGADVALMLLADDGAHRTGARATMPHTREGARALIARDAALDFAVRDADGPLKLRIEDLSDWTGPAAPPLPEPRIAIVDPELGRLMVHDARPLWVDYLPITLEGIGAAPPSRPWPGSFDLTLAVITSPQPAVPAGHLGESHRYEAVDSLQAALDRAARETGDVRIVLGRSGTIRSEAGWTFSPGQGRRTLTLETAPGSRPTLLGSLFLRPSEACRISLRGVYVRGAIVAGEHAELDIDLATLCAEDPATPSLLAEPSALRRTPITVRRSIVDAIAMRPNRPLHLCDSIVVRETRCASTLNAQRVTFIAKVRAHEISADDSVFNDSLRSGTTHTGFLRFCLIKPRSVTPVRFACFETDRQMLASCVFGRPRFARLHDDLPKAVRNGGSEGWEIGAFAHYAENTRIANLTRAISEFLPDTVSARVEFRS